MKDKKEEPGVQWRTHSEAETEQAGAELAVRLHPGTVVAMYGGLGMGKTAFVRGMAAGLGLSAEVSSPTFALVARVWGEAPSRALRYVSGLRVGGRLCHGIF